MRRIKTNILFRGLLPDPILNSLNSHYKNCRDYPLRRIIKKMLLKVANINLLQEEWGRQKAQLTTTLERVWTKSIAWTTPTTASLDNSQGHLKTQLKLDPSKKISL